MSELQRTRCSRQQRVSSAVSNSFEHGGSELYGNRNEAAYSEANYSESAGCENVGRQTAAHSDPKCRENVTCENSGRQAARSDFIRPSNKADRTSRKVTSSGQVGFREFQSEQIRHRHPSSQLCSHGRKPRQACTALRAPSRCRNFRREHLSSTCARSERWRRQPGI